MGANHQPGEQVGIRVCPRVRPIGCSPFTAASVLELCLDPFEESAVDQSFVCVFNNDPGLLWVVDGEWLTRSRKRNLATVAFPDLSCRHAVILPFAAFGPRERAGVVSVLQDRLDRCREPGTATWAGCATLVKRACE